MRVSRQTWSITENCCAWQGAPFFEAARSGGALVRGIVPASSVRSNKVISVCTHACHHFRYFEIDVAMRLSMATCIRSHLVHLGTAVFSALGLLAGRRGSNSRSDALKNVRHSELQIPFRAQT